MDQGVFVNAGDSANSVEGLPVPHFKKTAPFEFIRSVWRIANTEARPCFLPSSVSKNKFNKGPSGFLCGIGNPDELEKSHANVYLPNSPLAITSFMISEVPA